MGKGGDSMIDDGPDTREKKLEKEIMWYRENIKLLRFLVRQGGHDITPYSLDLALSRILDYKHD